MFKEAFGLFTSKGIHVTVLGIGQEWQGFETKITQVRDFCLGKNDNDIILLIDCYDMLPNNNLTKDVLLDLFSSLSSNGKNIIVGAESSCIANCDTNVKKVTSTYVNTSLFYPNTGFVMGCSKHMLILFNCMLNSGKSYDDQLAIAHVINHNDDKLFEFMILLDYERKLVHNVVNVGELNLVSNMVFQDNQGKSALFLHCPNIYSDGGKRYNKITKCLLNKKGVHKAFLKFVKHLVLHARNPAYKQIYGPVIIVIILLPIICCTLVKYRKCKRSKSFQCNIDCS